MVAGPQSRNVRSMVMTRPLPTPGEWSALSRLRKFIMLAEDGEQTKYVSQ